MITLTNNTESAVGIAMATGSLHKYGQLDAASLGWELEEIHCIYHLSY